MYDRFVKANLKEMYDRKIWSYFKRHFNVSFSWRTEDTLGQFIFSGNVSLNWSFNIIWILWRNRENLEKPLIILFSKTSVRRCMGRRISFGTSRFESSAAWWGQLDTAQRSNLLFTKEMRFSSVKTPFKRLFCHSEWIISQKQFFNSLTKKKHQTLKPVTVFKI